MAVPWPVNPELTLADMDMIGRMVADHWGPRAIAGELNRRWIETGAPWRMTFDEVRYRLQRNRLPIHPDQIQ